MITDFIALDLETATSKNDTICQIGYAVVQDLNIIKVESILVQPPYNKYDYHPSKIHGLSAKDTFFAPVFDQAWSEIAHYFKNIPIVVHNYGFDCNVLNKVALNYGIDLSDLGDVYCTRGLHGGIKLKECCEIYNVTLDNHHDAGCDAKACAEVFINYQLENGAPLEYINFKWGELKAKPKLDSRESERNKDNYDVYSCFLANKSEVPDLASLLQEDTFSIKINPFKDRSVALIGSFSVTKKSLTKKLELLGATVQNNPSRNSHYIIIGDNPSLKAANAKDIIDKAGFQYKLLTVSDIEDILLQKDPERFLVDTKIRKDIDLNIDYIASDYPYVDKDVFNYFANKVIFVADRQCGNKYLLNHIIGNLGAVTETTLTDEVDFCLLSGDTILDLKQGIKDDQIIYIENIYNTNKSLNFEFTFLSDKSLIDYYLHRLKQSEDNVLLDVFNSYKEYVKQDRCNTVNCDGCSLYLKKKCYI